MVRLYGTAGLFTYTPAAGRKLLAEPPYSEARWSRMRAVVPLAGSAAGKQAGHVELGQIEVASLSLDSWGWEPFTVWVDGLTFE